MFGANAFGQPYFGQGYAGGTSVTVAAANTWGAAAALSPAVSTAAVTIAALTWANEAALAPSLQTSNILPSALAWGFEATGIEGVQVGTVINANVAAVPTWGMMSAAIPLLSLGVGIVGINYGGAERAQAPGLLIVSIVPSALAWGSESAGPWGVLIGGAVVPGRHTVSDTVLFVHTVADTAVTP